MIIEASRWVSDGNIWNSGEIAAFKGKRFIIGRGIPLLNSCIPGTLCLRSGQLLWKGGHQGHGQEPFFQQRGSPKERRRSEGLDWVRKWLIFGGCFPPCCQHHLASAVLSFTLLLFALALNKWKKKNYYYLSISLCISRPLLHLRSVFSCGCPRSTDSGSRSDLTFPPPSLTDSFCVWLSSFCSPDILFVLQSVRPLSLFHMCLFLFFLSFFFNHTLVWIHTHLPQISPDKCLCLFCISVLSNTCIAIFLECFSVCVQCCKYPALSVYIFVYAIYMALCMQDSQWTVRKKKIIKDFKLKKSAFPKYK